MGRGPYMKSDQIPRPGKIDVPDAKIVNCTPRLYSDPRSACRRLVLYPLGGGAGYGSADPAYLAADVPATVRGDQCGSGLGLRPGLAGR